ncbi:MAG: class I SAM-dependent methyltransferase [Chitinophagaceae bacterium]|nr:MAG: class I SAM-dependent methyltransferase [Chitinophagaceae bacterium]
MASTGLFYDYLQPFYPAIDLFLRTQRRRLIGEVNRQEAGQLLDIGVGTGSHLPLYGDHLAITGIDVSKRMLHAATRRAKPGTSLLQMDGQELGFPDSSFQYVVLAHVIAVVKKPDALINEVYRVLQPGGKCFILNHFTPANALGYADRIFQPIGKLLHFRSNFTLADIPSIRQFVQVNDQLSGPFGYYRQIILEKK